MERSALHRKIKQLGISLTEKEETEKMKTRRTHAAKRHKRYGSGHFHVIQTMICLFIYITRYYHCRNITKGTIKHESDYLRRRTGRI